MEGIANGWYYRVQIDGKRSEKSTGICLNTKSGRIAAEAKAKQISEQLRTGNEEELAKLVRRPGYATAGEVADIYEQHGPEASRRAGATRFAAYVRDVSGRDDWREQSCADVLKADALREWIRQQRAAGRSENGIHSDVQTIKSVVARKRSYLLKDLKLPALEDFHSVSGGSSATEGYQPIDRRVLKRMDAAARIPLRRENPRAWATYWLMRKAGLRNDEVQHLKWSWVDWQNDGTADLVLITRKDWSPKGRSGRVPIRARVLRVIQRALGEGEYVLPRTSETDAYNVTHRDINVFVRRFLPDEEKAAYNLRKEFGATISARDGIEVASRLLRHRDISTTFAHYHNLIKRPKPL